MYSILFRIGLPEVMDQLQNLVFRDGEKLIIWIDDEPEEGPTNASSSFCQVLMTELLRVKVEPEIGNKILHYTLIN